MMNKQALTYALCLGGMALSILSAAVQADSLRLQWPVNKHFYQRFDQPLPWQAAQTKCRVSGGGHLVTITSDAERDFINNNVSKTGASWIGASDAVVNGKFTWVTGEAWRYQSLPSNFKNAAAVDYLWANPYEWGSNKATDMNIYVCEWSSHIYLGLASVPDFNGNGVKEVAVLYIDYITQKHTVKIRDPKTDVTLSTLTFKSGSPAPQGFVILSDLNGNRVPEVGVLYSEFAGVYSDFGQPSVVIKDAKNDKVYLKTVSFLNPSFTPKEITVTADSNNNGFSEITVLGMGKDNNAPKVETRDSKTGALLNDTQF
jgi:Lectin C-type domain